MAKKGTDTPGEFRASHRFARISARKARLVIDLIRGRSAEAALRELKVCMKRAAPMISKVLRSAMANATQMAGLEPGRLYVSRAVVNEGSTFKRWRPRAMGRAYPRLKRSCHIEVSVAQASEAGSGKSARSPSARTG